MRAARRFPTTLVAAACVHAVSAFALAAMRAPIAPAPAAPEEAIYLVDDVDDEPSSPALAEIDRAAPASPEPLPAVARAERPALDRTPEDRAPGDRAAEPAAVAERAPEATDDGGDLRFTRRGPIDLGIGGRWQGSVDATATATTEKRETITPSQALDRMLREGLTARDRTLGLSPGNPLISAAREAASPLLAPDVGVATLEVESDATGKIIAARVVSAIADAAAWHDVARELVTLMAGKTLRLPRGARGLRTRIRISAQRTLPAGQGGGTSSGAIPDDAPGGERACEGTGSSRRCVGGMPAGATTTGWDLTNIGAARLRVVHVQLLDDVAL